MKKLGICLLFFLILFSFNLNLNEYINARGVAKTSVTIDPNRFRYILNDDNTATIFSIDLGTADQTVTSQTMAIRGKTNSKSVSYKITINTDEYNYYKSLGLNTSITATISYGSSSGKLDYANFYNDGSFLYSNSSITIPDEIDGYKVTGLTSVYDLKNENYQGTYYSYSREYTADGELFTISDSTPVKQTLFDSYDKWYVYCFFSASSYVIKPTVESKLSEKNFNDSFVNADASTNIFSYSNDLRAYGYGIYDNSKLNIFDKTYPEHYTNSSDAYRDGYTNVYYDQKYLDGNEDGAALEKYTSYSETYHIKSVPTTLTSIVLPSTITNISENAFNGLSNIITLSGDGNYSKEIQSAFKDLTALVSVTLNNTEIIYANVFKNITTLKSVSFTSATQIGESAFYGCSNLADATFGKLINVYDNAFYECSSLKSDLDTSGLTILGNQAFYGCSSLKTLNLDNITSINKDDILGCISLTTLNLSKVKEIPVDLFAGMLNLVNLNIATATSLYDSAFLNFTNLSTVDISSITNLPTSVFKGCTSLSDIKLDAIKTLGDEAFYGCSSLASIKNIDRITSIGLKVFYGCSSLTNLNLPLITEVSEDLITGCISLSILSLENVKEVPITFFNSLTNLTELNINSLNSIYAGQFMNYTKLIKVSANSVSIINENAFSGCSSLKDVYLNSLITIKENAFSNCIELLSLNLATVLKIGENAFLNCTKLDNININNVETLNTAVFDGCISLTKVYLNNLKTIGTYAFRNCISLSTLELPNVTTIATSVFDGCTNLEYTYLYQTLVAIADNVLTPNLKNTFVFDNKKIYSQSLLVANMEKYLQQSTYKVRVSYINTNNLENSIFTDAFNLNLNNYISETTDTGITYYTYIAGNELIIPTIDDMNNITIDEKNIVNYKIYTLKENDVYSEVIDSNNSTSNNYISNKILQKDIVSDKLNLYVCLAINFDAAIKANLLDTLFIQNVSTTNDNQDITNVSFKDLNSTYKFEFKLKNEALSLPVEGYTYTYEWSNNTETNINNNSIEFNDILMFKKIYNVKLNIVSNDGTFNYTISSNDYSFIYTIGQISVEIIDQVRYIQGVSNKYGKDYKVYIDGILLTQEEMDLYFNSGYGLVLNGDNITFNGTIKDEYKDMFTNDISIKTAKVTYKKTIIISIISSIGVVVFGIVLYLIIRVFKRKKHNLKGVK